MFFGEHYVCVFDMTRGPLRALVWVLALWPAAIVRAQAEPRALVGEWSGAIRGPVGSWTVALHVVDGDSGLHATADFPDADAYVREFTVAWRDTAFELLRSNAGGGPMRFVGRRQGDSLVGTWTGYGHDAPFLLQRQPAARPRYHQERVTFHNDSVTLAGTLYLPNAPGRHRAIVCVHGSGPVDRSSYAGKAAYLATRGTATLVYDKRGVGQSTGDWQSASGEDLAGDARAGVRLLRQRVDIDSTRVGIEGFSQGGWIGPLAATESRAIAFVITGSASGINPGDQSIYDVAHQLAKAGFDSAAVARASDLRRRMYASAEDSVARLAVDADLAAAHAAPWFTLAALPDSLGHAAPPPGAITFLRLDPPTIWRKVHVPVLAYWGSRDTRVPPDSSLAVVKTALGQAGERDVTLRIFPGADHVMVLASAAPATAWDFPRTAPYLHLIAEWLSRR